MMRSDPHPSSTAEKSRFSMMALTAIHQRLLNAEARVGAMLGGRKRSAARSDRDDQKHTHTRTDTLLQRERERSERERARVRERE